MDNSILQVILNTLQSGNFLKCDRTLIVENLQKGLIVANSTHVCNMDIRHITALKDEMTCRVANLTGIMFMAIDIASQWLFYVDSDNHALMQYSLIFNVTTPITEAGPNVTGACVFIYINVLGSFSWTWLDALFSWHHCKYANHRAWVLHVMISEKILAFAVH